MSTRGGSGAADVRGSRLIRQPAPPRRTTSRTFPSLSGSPGRRVLRSKSIARPLQEMSGSARNREAGKGIMAAEQTPHTTRSCGVFASRRAVLSLASVLALGLSSAGVPAALADEASDVESDRRRVRRRSKRRNDNKGSETSVSTPGTPGQPGQPGSVTVT